ncbi:MAG: hypothetical protein P8172_01055 [Gammaproteobacteria bacterium]
MTRPVIVFVPGMRPKPEPDLHRQQVWRTLLEGVRRADEQVAAAMRSCPGCLTLADWTWLFYGSHAAIDPDLPAIEELLQKPGPTERDVAEARSWSKRLLRLAYLLGDMLPFLIPHLADERMQVTLADVRRYVHNVADIGRRIRHRLEIRLEAAWLENRPVLLIGHSMGSVIAWDALWELSRVDDRAGRVDLFLTLGSPLGQRFVQRRLKSNVADGVERYPTNIRRWVNIAAIGELTALDRSARRDFGEMIAAGLVEDIEDYEVLNFFRREGELHVHSEYGYLVNRTTGGIIADWWRSNR